MNTSLPNASRFLRRALLGTVVALGLGLSVPAHTQAQQWQTTLPRATIKTRTDHLSNTRWVLVVSYLPSEITSITCDKWTMLGVGSYKHQNDFTLPAGPTVAVMDANSFDGYCKAPGSIRAHTDDGDFVGVLDRGDGNWSDSTKLTFAGQR